MAKNDPTPLYLTQPTRVIQYRRRLAGGGGVRLTTSIVLTLLTFILFLLVL